VLVCATNAEWPGINNVFAHKAELQAEWAVVHALSAAESAISSVIARLRLEWAPLPMVVGAVEVVTTAETSITCSAIVPLQQMGGLLAVSEAGVALEVVGYATTATNLVTLCAIVRRLPRVECLVDPLVTCQLLHATSVTRRVIFLVIAKLKVLLLLALEVLGVVVARMALASTVGSAVMCKEIARNPTMVAVAIIVTSPDTSLVTALLL